MAKRSKKSTTPSVQNFVHKHMVLENKCVAHKSLKDYDRKQLKQQLKRETYD